MASPFHTSVVLRGEQTGGELSAVVNTVPAGWAGPPLHRHDFDETFYVLDGELTFQLGAEIVTAGPGALAFARGGVPHTLANRSAASARYLLLCTPAGFERYFDRLAAEAAGTAPPPEAEGPVPPTTVLGPSLGERHDAEPSGALEPGRGRINVLVNAERTGGRISVMGNRVPAGTGGPPLHHHGFDELFYVVEGELTFRLGDELVTRRAGELAFAPRGAHHAFANRGAAPARTLIACTPAGFERYFARMAAEHDGVEPPAWARQPTPEVVRVGPPIGA
jgi:mannose-6-phosphate isomerase-like protein (cupin superfamily)